MQRAFFNVTAPGTDPRDQHRWMLLGGWFLLISTVLSFVIASPRRVQPTDGLLIALAGVALVGYTVAVKKYWMIGFALLITLMAVIWSIVA
jgi:hypothetical protein